MTHTKSDGPELPPDQRAALDALTPKRRAFVLAFIGEAAGNATEAARRAGYRKPHPEGARLLRIATVRSAVRAFAAPAERASIATTDELRALWSRWAREGTVERVIDGRRVTEPLSHREMVKASELLAKSQAALVQRHDVTTPDGPLVTSREDAVRRLEAVLARLRGAS